MIKRHFPDPPDRCPGCRGKDLERRAYGHINPYVPDPRTHISYQCVTCDRRVVQRFRVEVSFVEVDVTLTDG